MPSILLTDVPKRVHNSLKKRAIDAGVTLPVFIVRVLKNSMKTNIAKGAKP